MLKKTVAILMAMLMLVGVAACGGSTPTTTNGPVTVTVMTWENTTTNAAIDAALQTFMRQNPNIKVTRIPSPNTDYGTKLSSMAIAHQLPDIFWAGNDTEQEMGAVGQLFDWSSYASQSGNSIDMSKFAPASLDNWKSGSQLFGLPTLMNTYGVWYNEDLFTKAGLALPKPGWTYDEMLKDAQALTQKNGNSVTRYGLWNAPMDPFAVGTCAVSDGGQPFENKIINATKVTADSAFMTCAQHMATAVQNGSVTPPGYDTSNAQSGFLAGQIPMLNQGQWFAPSFMQGKPSFKYGFVPMPIMKTSVQPYDAVGIASPANVQNPGAVWKVMEFLASKAWESVLPSAPVAPTAYLPSSTPYFNTLNSSGLQSVSDAVNYELNCPNKQGIRFVATWSGKANDIITADWNNILNGKTSVANGVPAMVQQLNAVISQGS
jgi:ABC-type glycerol-3-phosphate transport system substrate-binding protein